MGERTTEEYVYEYWDCPRCGHKGIRGDERSCNQCGFDRDDTISFYRKESDEVVQDQQQVEDFKKGPDWVCSFCGSLISQKDGKCTNCGATKDESVKNYFDVQKRKEEEMAQYAPPPEETQEDTAGKGPGKKLLALIGCAILIIGAGAFWITRTKDIAYTVSNVSWERSVAIDRYQQRTLSHWKNEMKGDERTVISEKREIRSYENRQVGTRPERYTVDERYQAGTKEECTSTYKSTGSGASKKVTKCVDVPVYKNRKVTKTRQVPVYKKFPVYDTKVTYSTKLYATFANRKSAGKDNNPQGPKYTLGTGINNKQDREGKKNELYTVTVKKKNEKNKGPSKAVFSTTLDRYRNTYKLNSDVELKVSNIGNIQYKEGEKEISAEK